MFFIEGINFFLGKRFNKNGINMGIAQSDEPSPPPSILGSRGAL